MMLKNALILLLFCLFSLVGKAQYTGGSGDGYAMGETGNVVLSTEEIFRNQVSLKVYPNPAKLASGFHMEFRTSGAWSWLEIYDRTGKLKYKTILPKSGNMRVNLPQNQFVSGVYILRLRSNNGQSKQQLIVLVD